MAGLGRVVSFAELIEHFCVVSHVKRSDFCLGDVWAIMDDGSVMVATSMINPHDLDPEPPKFAMYANVAEARADGISIPKEKGDDDGG